MKKEFIIISALIICVLSSCNNSKDENKHENKIDNSLKEKVIGTWLIMPYADSIKIFNKYGLFGYDDSNGVRVYPKQIYNYEIPEDDAFFKVEFTTKNRVIINTCSGGQRVLAPGYDGYSVNTASSLQEKIYRYEIINDSLYFTYNESLKNGILYGNNDIFKMRINKDTLTLKIISNKYSINYKENEETQSHWCEMKFIKIKD